MIRIADTARKNEGIRLKRKWNIQVPGMWTGGNNWHEESDGKNSDWNGAEKKQTCCKRVIWIFKNLVKTINCRVIPVAAYVINVCNFTGKELDQPDKGIKKILKENHMHGKQCSD